MQYLMERREGEVTLLHLTTQDRLCSIERFGLLPSYYGDLSVEGNDGAGIYAILPNWKAVQNVLNGMGPMVDSEIFVLRFSYKGIYYQCVDAVPDEEDMDEGNTGVDHLGYVVIPYDKVHPISIPWKDMERVVALPVLRSEMCQRKKNSKNI